jgi:hypothetical protein
MRITKVKDQDKAVGTLFKTVLAQAAPSIYGPHSPMPKIKRYDTRTELTQQQPDGDTEAGDPVVENQEEIDCTPDEIDAGEGLTAVDLAAKYIVENSSGNLEPSQAPGWGQGTWYSSYEDDMRTGDILETSFHLEGFTPAQEQEIYARITGGARKPFNTGRMPDTDVPASAEPRAW